MKNLLATLASLAVVAGCAGNESPTDSPGQIGGEPAGCAAVETINLGPNELSPLGFSPADVRALADGERVTTMAWSAGGQSDVTITTTTGDQAVFVDYEPTGGAEIACADAVEMEGTTTIATADGKLQEVITTSFRATSLPTVSFFASLDVMEIAGTYEVTEVEVTEGDVVTLTLSGQIEDTGLTGTLSGTVETSMGDEPDDAVSANNFSIGTF